MINNNMKVLTRDMSSVLNSNWVAGATSGSRFRLKAPTRSVKRALSLPRSPSCVTHGVHASGHPRGVFRVPFPFHDPHQTCNPSNMQCAMEINARV
eukprot:5850624-Amphidinium_carterae.1